MVFTSYFASRKFDVNNGVSISRWNKFWKGQTCPDLFPSTSLLTWWKSLDKTSQESPDNRRLYVQRYFEETLSKLNPKDIYDRLDGKVLLCYEKTGDFCHRHIVSDWLRQNGFEAKEL